MIKKVSQIVAELADREAIRDCLYRYCRGIDRMDAELLLSAYWPDAIDVHAVFTSTSAQDFVDKVMPKLAGMKRTSLNSTNIMIDIQGDTAYVESITRGLRCVTRPDGTSYDQVEAGRYLDIMECRDDEWRIKKRVVLRDWYREYPDTQGWDDAQYYKNEHALAFGMRKPDDLSYEVLKRKL